MILKGKGGIQYNLEATPFAQGGEGQIFNINGHPDKVAKLYKAGKITPDHEKKLLKMVITPPEQDVLDQIAWPLDVLYDNNKFVGFIMRKFKLNEDLNVIYEYGSSAKYPEMTWGNKIRIAKNLCVVLNAVHEAGHVCGDFNPKNISVDPNTGHITFVDTDSYHITDGSNTYRCNVGMPEYLPVEIQKKMHNGLSNAALPTFSQATDNFALAVHIFQLLMNGVHPFACAVIPSQDSVPIPSTSDSILNGECPFFKNIPGKQIPKFAPPADILPPEIKKLFLLAFVEGHASPSARPSAEIWYYALEKLENSLKQCKDVGHHEYHSSLSSCPWCAADKRFSGALSSTKSKGLKQSQFTPPSAPSIRNPSYTPSNASVSSTRGSSSPSYVGANNYGSASNYKKGGFTKNLIGGIIAVALIAALFGFVIWPNLIYPNMANDDFNTPEIVQSYCYSTEDKDTILTITECTADGQVKATWEFINDGKYGKVNLTGKIVEKKNNGNVVIEWTSNSVEIMPEGITWTDEKKVSISKNWTNVKSDTLTLTSGTNDKYTIASASDFGKMSGSSLTYFLKNDIDLAGVNWTPIEGFSGTLVGNGYTIKNLTIDASTSNVGLFSTLSGFVNNLKIENANITVSGRNENVGILCGNLEGNATNISVSGTVNAEKCTNVGGVFGYAKRSALGIHADLNLANLTNSASISGLSNVGGIAGYTFAEYVDVTFASLKNFGSISASEDYAGGIGGCMAADPAMSSQPHVQISDCENSGDVSGRYYVGGITGYVKSGSSEESAIDNCICKANIKGEAYVGCIAGKVSSVPINNCKNEGSTLTATGSISENNKRCAYVGGFVGAGCDVSNCTNEVEIKYTGGGCYVGGIIGYANRSISPDYLTFKNVTNNAPVSGADYVGGVAGYLLCEYITLQVEAASNTADISGRGDYVGGIIGFGRATDYDGYVYIYDSNNSGNITGKNYVGGIVGYGRANYKGSVISGSASTGRVNGNSKTGNIAGELEVIVIE